LAKFIVACLATLSAFVALDVFWFAVVVTPLYYPLLQDFLRREFLLLPGLLFYVLYTVALVVLAVRPGDATQGAAKTAGLGFILGLGAYGAYDLTNLATLEGWPPLITAIDLIWGAVLSSLSALAGWAVVHTFFANHSR